MGQKMTRSVADPCSRLTLSSGGYYVLLVLLCSSGRPTLGGRGQVTSSGPLIGVALVT